MAAWRFGKKWTQGELNASLDSYAKAPFNYELFREGSELIAGWLHLCTESMVAKEKPGAPGAAFEAAWEAIASYRFSDPRIVEGHFRAGPLENRTICQELKVGSFSFLCGVRVTAVREIALSCQFQRGFRYDTLEGHLERGAEWFLLNKDLSSGNIFFRIATVNGPGSFPNWWTRLGFFLFAKWYRRLWHRQAFRRIRSAVSQIGANAQVLTPADRAILARGSDCQVGFLRE
jgi:uncharacterized protein (UPF0548 family)